LRFVLAIVLAVAAIPARAEWVPVGKPGRTGFLSAFAEDGYYIDPSTISAEGNFRKVWQIHDMKEKGTEGQRSVLASVEYDCAAKRMRTINATGRSQRMAKGEIIRLRSVFSEWINLQPGRDHEAYFRILETVCAAPVKP
jgi:hypothetical protein